GEDRRSLESEDQLFTITVEEALQLLAEPPRRRGQARTSVLADLGEDPGSGKKITVRNGRFGPYVTDGEVNASLRKGDDPSKMTLDRALELLAARRERLASGQRMVAAISASGDRTDLSTVTWANSGDPRSFSISAAMPPYGEM